MTFDQRIRERHESTIHDQRLNARFRDLEEAMVLLCTIVQSAPETTSDEVKAAKVKLAALLQKFHNGIRETAC